MADIVIRGMEMPEYCYECPCHNGESGYCQAYKSGYLSSIERPAKCPLLPLPEGHGRLVDEKWIKNAMITTLQALKKHPKMDKQEAHLIAAFDTLRAMLDDAPTIVPAEGGEADGN